MAVFVWVEWLFPNHADICMFEFESGLKPLGRGKGERKTHQTTINPDMGWYWIMVNGKQLLFYRGVSVPY